MNKKANIVRAITGEVLLEIDGAYLDESMQRLSFFVVPKVYLEAQWDRVWSLIRGGEIYKLEPKGSDWMIAVCNESIEWR